MHAGVLWLLSFSVTVTEGHASILGRRIGTRARTELGVAGPDAAQEYELLLQVTYGDPQERRLLERSLQHLEALPPCFQGPERVLGAKATTYCSHRDRALRCACVDSYSWFPPSCLDPRHCHLSAVAPLPSCECRHANLSQSVHFCERAKVWGGFRIKEELTEDLLNPSSASFSKYASMTEKQLKAVYQKVKGFESVQVTQFRPGSIAVGYEVIGSRSSSELLSALEGAAHVAEEALARLLPVEEGSFVVAEEGLCFSSFFGFGFMGDEFTLPCGSGFTGTITAKCQSSQWQVAGESCVLSQLVELQKNISAVLDNATEADVASVLRNLSLIVQQGLATSAGSLASVVSILSRVSFLSQANHLAVSDSTLEDVIKVADRILDPSSVSNWTILMQAGIPAGAQLLETLENISVLVAPAALPLNFSQKFINWKGIPGSPSQHKEGYKYQIKILQEDAPTPIRGQVLIGPEQFRVTPPETIISMASLTFRDILPITQDGGARVNGPVLTTVIHNYSITDVLLVLSKVESNLSQARCVFWDSYHLRWSGAGCQLVNETPEAVVCRCAHLTSFSILMSPSVPSVIVPAVKWITYLGLGVSAGSLILCLVVEAVFWNQVRKPQTSHLRHVCLVNIALSLLLADIWFIVAASVDAHGSPSGVCTAATFITHFFYLALFSWMLALGLLLVYRITLVFHHLATPLMVAVGFCLGYGCPLVICVITVAVTEPSNSYRRKDACWLNWSDGSKPLLAFVVPALTVVAVNVAVVLMVLSKLWRPAVGETVTQNDKATIVRVGKGLLVLAPTLGLTWGFGIGTMADSQNPAWHVLFALSNAFQGFLIFCFGTLLDGKLRQLLCDKLPLLSSWKQTSKQNASHVPPRIKSPTSSNPLRNKGKYAVSHPGDPSSEDITLTQFFSTG